MKNSFLAIPIMALATITATAQNSFEITGTPIPAQLLSQNYGSIAKGINAYDLNICNITDSKQSLTSSKVYQALMDADATLQPIGKQIMLASILRSQNHSVSNLLNIALSSATSVLSLLGSSTYRMPQGWTTAAALAALGGQQVLTNFKPVLSAGQLEKFESQVLESALVMDSGTCVERTVFALSTAGAKSKAKPQGFNFRVR